MVSYFRVSELDPISDHPNNIWWETKFNKILVVVISQAQATATFLFRRTSAYVPPLILESKFHIQTKRKTILFLYVSKTTLNESMFFICSLSFGRMQLWFGHVIPQYPNADTYSTHLLACDFFHILLMRYKHMFCPLSLYSMPNCLRTNDKPFFLQYFCFRQISWLN